MIAGGRNGEALSVIATFRQKMFCSPKLPSMRRFIKPSVLGLFFVVSCASALYPKASFTSCQRADSSTPEPATQTISEPVDFEVKLDPARVFLVRRKGTSEWLDSSKLKEPIVIGLLDGARKIYAPSKAIKPPKAKHMEAPDYLEKERNAQERGRAVLHLIVDEQGAVRLPTVDASPNPEFAKAAIDAVKKWTFEPAKLNGQAVAALIRVEMQFGLY